MLRVRNLDAYYNKAKILNDVNLEVGEGEVVAILGPNGAGKTTLLKSVCGLVDVKGEIYLNGEKITNLKPHERIRMGISICPEGRRLFPNMSVEDNLLLGAIFNGNYKENLKYVFNLFPRLEERRKQLAKTMSGGEQQMLAIARALMSEPSLLLLDEPSMGLAPIVIESIAEALKRIKKDLGVSMLIVEQNVHLAFEVADKAYVLVKGEIVRQGSVDELQDLEEDYFEV
ncbi:branched-chain amino acid ABC transporter ATP-binding protein [Archaeoglobales archaeon]|nr:MAG: branched-chain amino acid ABC transporter ATP-binding protein [Archaeoglobales archaeon]